ncbi:5-oxoprolinase subunit B family protein [Nocardia vaccinii]|uniref:5-oxoprolinase subunit B family protein n=1 Tax=Nocardia vaccinii TaxID=1822 RepID=UPI00083775DD|nr:allophanate hydrolase subunit 1 [Nocardia vaccinii]
MSADVVNEAELTIRQAGDRALLVEPSNRAELLGFIDRLRDDPVAGVWDVLPAARTILITLRPGVDVAVMVSRLRAAFATVSEQTVIDVNDGAAVEIPVHYDGADLAETANLLGISEPELIARHTAALWRCAFVGFAPGFGYLEASSGAELMVPRRRQSRTAVPAGSVALAAGYSAIYPRSSPGGWRIIGRTTAPLWDVDRLEPALLRPGTRVRFTAVEIAA